MGEISRAEAGPEFGSTTPIVKESRQKAPQADKSLGASRG
jgi:hypothetical protein